MSSSPAKINFGFLLGLAAVVGLVYFVFIRKARARSLAAAAAAPLEPGDELWPEDLRPVSLSDQPSDQAVGNLHYGSGAGPNVGNRLTAVVEMESLIAYSQSEVQSLEAFEKAVMRQAR